jgi:siroheme synthase (precorrin-2 oxidase/ferrochelatase)
MAGLTREDIQEAVREALDEQCYYPDEHRQFINALIKREHVRAERWEAIKIQILGWGAVAAVGWIGTQIAKGLGWH